MVSEVRPTLQAVLAALGEVALSVVVAPRGLEVAAGEPVLYDPLDDDRLGPDLIVLGPGCDGPAAETLVRAAAADGAAAVVLKARPGVPYPVAAAEAAGVALLAVPPDFAWGQLLSLLRAAVDGVGSGGGDTLDADDLFGVANAIAAALGGPVTIEDRHSRVLAYSSLDQPVDEGRRLTILGRQVPDRYLELLRDDGVFPRLWASQEPIRVDGLGDLDILPRMAVAVRAGGEVLGSVWVAQGERELDDAAARLLADAAPVAALHLVRRRGRRDLATQRREQAVAALLSGEGDGIAFAALDLPADESLLVVAVEAVAGGASADAEVDRVRLAGLADLSCAWWRAGAVRAWVDGRLYLLLPGAGEGSEARAERLAGELAERARSSLRQTVLLGIGSAGAGAAHAGVSRAQADRALGVLQEHGGATVAAYTAVRAQAQALEVRDLVVERAHLRDGRLGDLVRHDAVHGTDYVATVRAYLRAFGDVPLAAGAVGIHPNTFRYRLRRLAELSGLDLDDPDERLMTEVQLLTLER